ncbi:armadillo repeat-containing protein 10 [Mantella aurantiaca]
MERGAMLPAITRGLLGLAVGTGLCYCAYRVLAGNSRRKENHVTKRSLLERVASMGVTESVRGRGHRENIPMSAGNLESHHLKALLDMLDSDADDVTVQEQVLITLGNCAAFSANHPIIRNFNGIKIIGRFRLHSSLKIRIGALNALNNLSMNMANQEQIKDYLQDVCNDIMSSPLNSEVQLAALRLVINMSVTNNYHDYLKDYIPCFLTLLVDGEEATQIHTLKVLVNLSANLAMATDLLSSKVQSSFPDLFSSNTSKDILIRMLTFAANLSENLAITMLLPVQHRHYGDHSLYSYLFGDQGVFQGNLVDLLEHPDKDIREHVAKVLCPKKMN